MRASTSLQRTLWILTVGLLCALPAFAAEAQAPTQAVPPAAALTGPACAPAFAGLLITPAQPVENAGTSAWIELGAKRFHGYCHCGCSPIADCNTDADCGGATCGRGISCC
jgi:hypothetical protein